jgi:NAD(P)-dependent dehydrogenase (short-subunit alcohol dehydrogenase family)
VDILVNNAGKGHSWFFEAVEDTSEFPKIADIDFWGNVRTASALDPLKQHHVHVDPEIVHVVCFG